MRSYYQSSIHDFLKSDPLTIIGRLTSASGYGAEEPQVSAWAAQIELLKPQLKLFNGKIYFEFVIPRMGKRVDVVIQLEEIIILLEFKVGENKFNASDIDQVWDYALDLKFFHSTSYQATLIPVLVATEAKQQNIFIKQSNHNDGVIVPILISGAQIRDFLDIALS